MTFEIVLLFVGVAAYLKSDGIDGDFWSVTSFAWICMMIGKIVTLWFGV